MSAWAVLARSAIGTSHIQRTMPCQDACRVGRFGPVGEWLAIAVADGAGSAGHSEIGATVVCESLLHALSRAWPERPITRSAMVALFEEARDAVFLEAEHMGVAPRELASTALFAIVGPAGGAFAQIGDGAIVVGSAEQHWLPVTPRPSEYANETDFLTGDRFPEALDFAWVDEAIEEFALLTDGLQHLAIDHAANRPHTGFFRPFFEALRTSTSPEELEPALGEFLESSRVNERTDDDKTLAVAVRRA